MDYPLTCTCGRTLHVPDSAAGGDATCESCRAIIPVPKLSDLRKASNLGAFETSSLDRMNRLITEGRMPDGNLCMISGRPITDLLEVELLCEKLSYKKSGTNLGLALMLGGLWAMTSILMMRKTGEIIEVHGRETTAFVPLRIDREHHKKLMRKRALAKLRELLRSIPAVVDVLTEFPETEIVKCHCHTDGKETRSDLKRLFE
jgi:hypothetical protein